MEMMAAWIGVEATCGERQPEMDSVDRLRESIA